MITIVVLPVWAAALNAVSLLRGWSGREVVPGRRYKQPDWLAEPASCRGFDAVKSTTKADK